MCWKNSTYCMRLEVTIQALSALIYVILVNNGHMSFTANIVSCYNTIQEKYLIIQYLNLTHTYKLTQFKFFDIYTFIVLAN